MVLSDNNVGLTNNEVGLTHFSVDLSDVMLTYKPMQATKITFCCANKTLIFR